MSIKNIFDRFFYLEDEDFEEEAQNNPKKTQESRQQPEPVQPAVKPSRVKKERRSTTMPESPNNVVSIASASSTKSSKVVLVEPRVYAEAQDIAENLKNKRATIVNLQRIDREQAIRIIDFLSGTVYALGGEIQRVGTNIFLCTPDNVEVSGEISDYLLEDI
jgi:cell division inhibitor SepF